jgi:hypothetical protein
MKRGYRALSAVVRLRCIAESEKKVQKCEKRFSQQNYSGFEDGATRSGAPMPGSVEPHLGGGPAIARRRSKLLSYGSRATTRVGAPLPPLIFMGSAITVAPVSGSRSRLATFSNP